MPRKFWWPTTIGDQSMLVLNFQNKIGGYAAVLGLTAAEVTAAETLCDSIVGSMSFTEGSRMTMLAVTQWRDIVLYGEPEGGNAPAPPVFSSGGAPAYKVGSVKLFFQLRDRIVSSPGYTTAIGEDLGLIGPENTERPASELTPNLRPTVTNGNYVNLAGSMQGMDALRVEYAPRGGQFSTIAFLTKTPGGFQITPTVVNQPETGMIRAVFIKKNEDYGNFSPNYPVTVS